MSAEALTGDLLPRPDASRHDALMKQFARGACLMCIALYKIRSEQTFKAAGFKGFGEFLTSVGMSETNGRRYASCGPMLELMYRDGDLDLIKHPDMLRPIAGMISAKQPVEKQQAIAKRQVGIVRAAANRAKHELRPLDEDLIAATAANTGWLPPAEYKKRLALQRGETPKGDKTPEQLREEMQQDLERAFDVIRGYRRTGPELVAELGPPTGWRSAEEVREILNDAWDAME